MIRFANFARLGVALTLTASIGAQIPTRSGTALAADGCCQTTGVGCGGSSNNGGNVFGTNLNWEEVGSGTLIAVVLCKVVKTLKDRNHPETTVSVSTGGGSSPEAGSLASSNSLLDTASESVRGLLEQCPSLAKTLQNDGPYTLFLPSDETLSKVRLDPARLESLLKRHIVIGRYSYDDLTQLSDGATLQTLAETKLAVTHADGNVQIGGITVPSVAQVGNNGFQFVIEGILP